MNDQQDAGRVCCESPFVRYAFSCFRGMVRRNNEDNYYVDGKLLPETNSGQETVLTGVIDSGSNPVFAVFDGMGGMNSGETAAFLAADQLKMMDLEWREEPYLEVNAQDKTLAHLKAFAYDSCLNMNESVYQYAKRKHIADMGTTVAMVQFCPYGAAFMNLGDSRIYQAKDGMLSQLSVDHVLKMPGRINAPITQYIGMDPEEYLPQPEVSILSRKELGKVLLCTDGLFKMIPERMISQAMSEEKNPISIVEKLKKEVMDRGAVDNTTIMVCELVG